MAMATTAFEDLERAACCLLQIIRDTQELGKDTKVVIAGDMAMQKYLPKHRQGAAAVSFPIRVSMDVLDIASQSGDRRQRC